MKELSFKDYRDLEFLELYVRQVVEGFITGLHKSPYHGFSVEFSEHRSYNPGESLRNIDWKLYGRTDRLYTKRYEEETNLRCRLVLDTSGSMFFPKGQSKNIEQPNKICFCTIASMALMNLFRKQRDAVGLSLFGASELHTDARSTYQHHKAIALELQKALQYGEEKVKSESNMAESLHRVAECIHKRSLIILFSDLFELQENEKEILKAFQHLKYNKHELIIFYTTYRQKELEFDYEGRPYRFVDMESGDTLKLNPNEIRKRYLIDMQDFSRFLRLKCMQYQIDLVEADISRGYHSVLQTYLFKRKRMF